MERAQAEVIRDHHVDDLFDRLADERLGGGWGGETGNQAVQRPLKSAGCGQVQHVTALIAQVLHENAVILSDVVMRASRQASNTL